MADGQKWTKIHTLALTDPDLEDLGLEDWARWAKLLIYTKAHGVDGVLCLKAPSRALLGILDLTDFKEISALCGRLPNVQVTEGTEELTTEFLHWEQYQGSEDKTHAERNRRYRQRLKEKETGSGTLSRDGHGDSSRDGLEESRVEESRIEKNRREGERRRETASVEVTAKKPESSSGSRSSVSKLKRKRPRPDRLEYLTDGIRAWAKKNETRDPDKLVEMFEDNADANGWTAIDWEAKFRTFLTNNKTWNPIEPAQVDPWADYRKPVPTRKKVAE